MIEEMAGWIAPIATMIAAMMTAANLGARVTGWGFVVFTVGSIAWSPWRSRGPAESAVDQRIPHAGQRRRHLALAGTQARYDEGGQGAQRSSALPRACRAVPIGGLVGGPLVGRTTGDRGGGEVMIESRCPLAYVVVAKAGSAGSASGYTRWPGAMASREMMVSSPNLTLRGLLLCPEIDPASWPATSPAAIENREPLTGAGG